MSTEWRDIYFNKYSCKGNVINQGNGNLKVTAEVKSKTDNPTIIFWAAAPATLSSSYSGSGLPYANPEQAYDGSPNVGSVKAVNRRFEFNIYMPNAYYVGLGSLYVPPNIHFKICEPGSDNKFITIKLNEGIPFRTLTYTAPPSKLSRVSPSFYDNRHTLPVRSQEQILRDAGYPCDSGMPDNFWGLKPAQ